MMKCKSCFNLGCDTIRHKQKYNGILGISVGSRQFSKKNIEKYLKFCLEYFDKTLVIIIDSIKKYNFMAFYNISEKEAIKKANIEGNEFVIGVNKVLKNMKDKKLDVSKIKVIRWIDLVCTIPEYQKTVDILKEFYRSNIFFSDDVSFMVETYILNRNIKKLNKIKKKMLTNFILDEIALFLLIGISTKEKYCVEVYPAKFLVIQNIIENRYYGLLNKLPNDLIYGSIEVLLK